jgi:hypothetical protein
VTVVGNRARSAGRSFEIKSIGKRLDAGRYTVGECDVPQTRKTHISISHPRRIHKYPPRPGLREPIDLTGEVRLAHRVLGAGARVGRRELLLRTRKRPQETQRAPQ